MDDVLIGGVKF